jgi:hypothetical protein
MMFWCTTCTTMSMQIVLLFFSKCTAIWIKLVLHVIIIYSIVSTVKFKTFIVGTRKAYKGCTHTAQTRLRKVVISCECLTWVSLYHSWIAFNLRSHPCYKNIVIKLGKFNSVKSKLSDVMFRCSLEYLSFNLQFRL